MEFGEVVRRRKMVRTFQDRAVDPATIERILDRGRRAPSAGFTQGFAFLLLERPEETEAFWRAVAAREEEWPHEGVRRAPVIVVPLASKQAYLDRYAEPDKGWIDRDEARWPVPYWLIDAAFASLLVQLGAVDEGLGALFFGLDRSGYEGLRAAFGVPEGWEPIGVIAIGHQATADAVRSSRDTRPRKPLDEVVHRGRW